MEEPASYGKFGLANLLELREECLREFQFMDAYKTIKQRLAKHALIVLFSFPRCHPLDDCFHHQKVILYCV